jgi:transcriptional regulator with XRE-family HTH domain
MTPFSERLLQAARYAGVPATQAGIAKTLGLKRQTVNHWFTSGEPTAENLLEIASRWSVSAEWLRSGVGEMLPAPSGELPADERDLLRSYRSATPQTRQLLRSMARAARKSVFFLAATIPPLLSPSNAEAGAVLHNAFAHPFAPIANVIHIARKWLMNLALSCRRNFAM